MVTHISAREAPWDGHNARLSFVGRRVLETYLNLFLHSVPRSELPSGFEPDYVFIAHRALHTPVLGEYVGTQWRLRDIMQWTPARGFEETARVEERRQLPDTRLLSKNVGFYKVQGIAVEGIIGGIFHQFGGTVAHRVFHTRLLPHILCPGSPVGLPDHYHDFVNKVLLKMGGSEALLSGSNTRTSRTPKLADGVSAAVEAS
ncbi:hypothetical protein BD410DRAFT_786081 [Rickenella mellea]|uniref:Uncharacterized protein n=1 Tax=Rickenella mellea TaxID=50990 RepID=A0A4Y7QBB9_9AGAM|nr:hypothetical protein BD410DRAFT_786081 [Rickenella mellea]